jgi:hypothetical protein
MTVRATKIALLAALVGAVVVAGCATPPQRVARSSVATPTAAATPRTAAPVPSATAGAPSATRPAAPAAQLPRGGRRILPDYRVVAYYGAAGTPALGVLGSGSPDRVAAEIERRAAGYAAFGRPVQPAMELLATIAQRAPGPDGRYSLPVPARDIARYLACAHRHRMLLILDIQPGRGEFLDQVQALAPLLADPSVGVALDPEWKVGRHQVPGTVIGSASAASINAVAEYLHRLVVADHLPDKLLVVHEFTGSMLPDRAAIERFPGVEVVLHADGFGSARLKAGVYRRLALPAPPYHAGFKLFLRQDARLMTPAEVMALRPQPEVITYQ